MKRTRRRRVWWWLGIAALSLLLGLATTVAVPRVFDKPFASATVRNDSHRTRPFEEGYISVYRMQRADWDRLFADLIAVPYERTAAFDGWDWLMLIERTLSEPDALSRIRYPNGGNLTFATFKVSGWPIRCFYVGHVDYDPVSGISLPERQFGDAPWLPYAPGDVLIGPLLANTALLAVPWLVLLLLLWRMFAATRRRRMRFNHCPKCNYDRAGLAGDAVCPECGGKPASH